MKKAIMRIDTGSLKVRVIVEENMTFPYKVQSQTTKGYWENIDAFTDMHYAFRTAVSYTQQNTH